MPIEMRFTPERWDQERFTKVAYDVLGKTFEIHNEFGRFFDEVIYKRELSFCVDDLSLEEPIEVVFESYRKPYFIDVLAGSGAIFEFKATESLTERHRSQLINYLLLTGLRRGMLINVRTEKIQHEFVNCTLTPSDRKQFEIDDKHWQAETERDIDLKNCLVDFLRDIGVGLDISLYVDFATEFLGGEEQVVQNGDIVSQNGKLGTQKFRLCRPCVAFRITALVEQLHAFEHHARRILKHTELKAIHWININRSLVTFNTLTA
ncbi:GxxExxY protein [Novipirellula rosea]|uniref:GxxExxY protein n=1 Tax=Novipirellula rosea TaxID=1031540 RepID=A0ABP8NCW8_9BACT